jgi:nuclear GTP-binding protein
MKVGKPKSKRVPVRLRHKIQKASASKQRKERKEAKKNPQWKSRMKKDPGIPNLFPYKDKILAEIEDGRRKKEEEAVRRREEARARRGGAVVEDGKKASEVDDDDEDEVLDEADDDAEEEDDDMDVESNANPMAALLASAQARAQTYTTATTADDDEEDDEDEDENDASASGGVSLSTQPKSHNKKFTNPNTPSEPKRRPLPAAALSDPIKAVTKLLLRLEQTPEQLGLQQLLDHYAIAPLPPASNGVDSTSRFLVDVARKRGRLGRGGVPNLHAAAFTVLGDLHEERLRLPALEALQTQQQQGEGPGTEGKRTTTTTKMAALVAKGRIERSSEVQVVTTMAEPFRIEGLFGDD